MSALKWRRVSAVVLTLAVTCAGLAVVPASAASVYSLAVSSSGTRSPAVALEGASLTGSRYVFLTPQTGVRQVSFYLDDTARTGTPVRTERTAPYDLLGGDPDAPVAWDTAGLSVGTHTMTAAVTLTTGATEVVGSTFTITRPAGTPSLLASTSPSRSSAVPLAGASFSGSAYVFVTSPNAVRQVAFFLDDPARSGTPRQIEKTAPYDFAGGTATAATALDTRTLAAGTHRIDAAVTFTTGATAIVTGSFTTGAATPAPGAVSFGPRELVFSAVKGTTSVTRTATVTNTGAGPLVVTALGATTGFRVTGGPALPATVAAGGSLTVPVVFVPSSTTTGPVTGSLTASVGGLAVTSSTALPALYGLATQGLYGSLEPPLAQVVSTLGHPVDLGGTSLSLGTGAAPIGSEVLAPHFVRAGTGPVVITPVARFSPDGTVGYGWYRASGTSVTTTTVGTIATTTVGTIATGQAQTVLPGTVGGSAQSFDPGTTPFGLWSRPSSAARTIWTEDARNTGAVAHAVRSWPARDRTGAPIPATWLVGFEEASNGDYQDFLYRVSNVRPSAVGG